LVCLEEEEEEEEEEEGVDNEDEDEDENENENDELYTGITWCHFGVATSVVFQMNWLY
jgi:hypothetical protein